MKTNNILQIAFLVLTVMIFASCEYEFIKLKYTPLPNPNDTISFVKMVAPIFESNNCTSCHEPGGSGGLDLTEANAYNSIISNQLVSTSNPESSRIYTYPHPTTGSHFKKYSNEAEAQIIFQWIQQGAKNN